MHSLIEITKDYIRGNTTNIEVTEDLIECARIHKLEPLVFHQTRDARLKESYMNSCFDYQKRKKLEQEVSGIFEDNNIEYYYVKGMAIANCYPNPFVKTMGDSDIIVRFEDKEKAAKLLLANGYEISEENSVDGGELALAKKGLLFELHHALLYGEEIKETVNDQYIDKFSNCWEYVKDNQLDDSYHLLYLLMHLRKHLMAKGVGLRPFLDIAFFSRKELDWTWIEAQLDELELLEFANNVYGLIEAWWELSLPISRTVSNDFLESSTQMILEAGVFGGESDKDGVNILINRVNHGESIYKLKLRFFLPSYETLIESEQYSFLIGKPYLLPAAWVYRAVLHVSELGNKKHIYGVNETDVKERNTLFENWNLKERQ